MPEETPSGYFIVRFRLSPQTFFSFPPSTPSHPPCGGVGTARSTHVLSLFPDFFSFEPERYCVRGKASGPGSAQNLVSSVLIRSFLGFLPCHKINRSYGKARTRHDMFHLPRVANGGFYTLQRLHCNLPRAQNRTKTSRAEDFGTAPTPKVNLSHVHGMDIECPSVGFRFEPLHRYRCYRFNGQNTNIKTANR